MGKVTVLMLGDIVGAPGRRACRELIPALRKEEQIDFVIANGENMAGGSGVTEATAAEVLESGVDVVTTGDHIFKRRESYALLDKDSRILRPANYSTVAPGLGSYIFTINERVKIGVINLIGRVFMQSVECPFKTATNCVDAMKAKGVAVICVDLHAEATSEKIAMGWHLDGEVSIVAGTHTHVLTADETILPKGTAYITDLGMVGPYRSILGRDIKSVLHRFITQMPTHFGVATDDIRISGILVTIDAVSGKAQFIRRIHKRLV